MSHTEGTASAKSLRQVNTQHVEQQEHQVGSRMTEPENSRRYQVGKDERAAVRPLGHFKDL